MRKFLMLCAALTAAASQAQELTDFDALLDAKEDTTQIITIADIVNVQETVTTSNATTSHFNKVWGYKKYFDITYGGVKMTPKEDIPLGYSGYNNGIAPTFNSDWSLSLKFGRNYALHKKPLGNTVVINLDFNYFDLNVTHFKAEGDKNEKTYDSSATWQETNEDDGSIEERNYIPWCLQKYKIDFGMAVGPSITVAPFTHIKNATGLHFLKFNIYYHIGYHASILWMINDDKHDYNESSSSSSSSAYTSSSSDLKMNWGHGLTNTFGFSVSWKTIGIGYELRRTSLTYKSVTPTNYGHQSYKFGTESSRIYLQLRY